MAFILVDDDQHRKKINDENIERNDRHRRWFRTMSEINRQRIPGFGRTIPPPPPISRVNQEEVRSEWRRQNGVSKIKDFKFFQK